MKILNFSCQKIKSFLGEKSFSRSVQTRRNKKHEELNNLSGCRRRTSNGIQNKSFRRLFTVLELHTRWRRRKQTLKVWPATQLFGVLFIKKSLVLELLENQSPNICFYLSFYFIQRMKGILVVFCSKWSPSLYCHGTNEKSSPNGISMFRREIKTPKTKPNEVRDGTRRRKKRKNFSSPKAFFWEVCSFQI